VAKDRNESPAPEPVGLEIPIRSRSVPYGLEGVNRRILPGYILANGTALLEDERDAYGNYYGGAGMDGMYLKLGDRYASVKNEDGSVRAFRRVGKKQRTPNPPRKHIEPER
jgi:hypothetical protein